MSRTARLLELLMHIQTRSAFTAQALADEFGVSRRTMLRDLRALSEMGIALEATPGPGGGYSLPWGRRRLAMSFTLDEALALVIAYEALLRYSASPFAEANLSAATKLRAAMPADVVAELERVRQHIAVREPVYAEVPRSKPLEFALKVLIKRQKLCFVAGKMFPCNSVYNACSASFFML